jgi:aspartyl aminopeptidase
MDIAKEAPERTAVCLLTDKEEVHGFLPAMRAFRNFVNALRGDDGGEGGEGAMFARTAMLSADVAAGYDPMYASYYDKKTCPFLGGGLSISKSGTGNWADMAFTRSVMNLFDSENALWQYGDMGKVGKGGGGTIASEYANLGIKALDCGVPVLSMHSPFEVISKADLWETCKAFSAFYRKFEIRD